MIRKPALILAPLLFSLVFLGCRDKCKKLDCGVNGSCVEGECLCTSGYEGGLCETTVTAKFDKTYDLEESCTAGSDYYDVKMLPDAENPSNLMLIGLWEKSQDTVFATVSDDGRTITIERQPLDNVEVSGTGTALDGFGIDVEITYQVHYAGQSWAFDNCTATLSSQQ